MAMLGPNDGAVETMGALGLAVGVGVCRLVVEAVLCLVLEVTKSAILEKMVTAVAQEVPTITMGTAKTVVQGQEQRQQVVELAAEAIL